MQQRAIAHRGSLSILVARRNIMEDWKTKIGEIALHKGIIKDPHWLDRLDDPMPVWAVLELMLELLERVEPTYSSYD